MARRIGWDSLSDAQRRRYEAAGRRGTLSGSPFLSAAESRDYYESGGSLEAARGHRRPRAAGAAPKDATLRSRVNLLGDQDRKDLRTWRRSRRAPTWLPKSSETLRDDVAAILSEVDAPPHRWTAVEVSPSGSGHFTLRVFVRGREHPVVTSLPDRGSVSELATLLNDYGRLHMATGAERKRLQREWTSLTGKPLHIAVTITGTDPKARRAATVSPLTRPPGTSNALPKKTRREESPMPTPTKAPATKAAPAKKAPAKKAAAKKRKRASNLRDVSTQLLDLQNLLSPIDNLDAATMALLTGLIADVERLIG